MVARPSRRAGVVLLLVLGILALLSVLAISFVQVSTLEKSISRNYLDRTRAVLAAESGVEYAVTRLHGLRGGALLPDEMEDLRYEAGAAPGVENAAKASFQSPGTAHAQSGLVSDSYGPGSDYFALKVEDLNGKLNLNDSDGPWNQTVGLLGNGFRLQEIVTRLGDNLFGPGVGTTISIALFTERATLPDEKFTSMRQVRDLLLAGVLTEDQCDEFLSYCALAGWQDRNVIRPTFTMNLPGPTGITATDGPVDIYMFQDFQPGYYELEPRCPVNVNAAPIQLLAALIEPVEGWYLYEGDPGRAMDSIFGPWMKLQRSIGFSAEDANLNGGYFAGPYGSWASVSWPLPDSVLERSTRYAQARRTETISPALAKEIATAIYNRIHADPSSPTGLNPFETWDEFTRFLYTLVNPGVDISGELSTADEMERMPLRLDANCAWPDEEFSSAIKGLDRYQADALLANFNPNSMLNATNPDRHLFRHVDKAHLTQYTTELCFGSSGMYAIESAGVLRENGAILNRYTVRTTMQIFLPLRLSTQKQFMTGDDQFDKNGASPADIGTIYDVFAESADFLNPTAGCDIEQDTGDIAGRWGPSLTSYPEPIRNRDTLAFESHPSATTRGVPDYYSNYDGCLQLATLQPYKDSFGYITPKFLATMGYRKLASGESWAKRTLGVGGLLPVVMGANNALTTNPDPGHVRVGGGRGSLLTWGHDYTIDLDHDDSGDTGDDYPPTTWDGISPTPINTWLPDRPWTDIRHWNIGYNRMDETMLLFGGAMTFAGVGPMETMALPEDPVDPIPCEKMWRLSTNFPTDSMLTPDFTDPSGDPQPQPAGCLMADGAFSEGGRTLMYKSCNLGNAYNVAMPNGLTSNYGTEGGLCFWVKPNWEAGNASRPRNLFTNGHFSSFHTSALDIMFHPASRRAGTTDPRSETDRADFGYAYLNFSTNRRWKGPACNLMAGWHSNKYWNLKLTPWGTVWDFGGVKMTSTASDFFPNRDANERVNHEAYGFYGRQWNFISLQYVNYVGTSDGDTTQDLLEFHINGQNVSTPILFAPYQSGYAPYAYGPPQIDFYWEDSKYTCDKWVPIFGTPHLYEPTLYHIGQGYMRLGNGSDNTSPPADSTFDDLCIFPSLRSFGPLNKPDMMSTYLDETWARGRYQNALLDNPVNKTVTGMYTSPGIDLVRELELNASKSEPLPLRLHSLSWTLWWPRYNWRPGGFVGGNWKNWGTQSSYPDWNDAMGVDLHSSLPNSQRPEPDPVTGDIDPITVDIFTPASQWMYTGATGLDMNPAQTKLFEQMDTLPGTAAGSGIPRDKPFSYARGDDFHFRVYFHMNVEDINGNPFPLLESPAFDDITFLFELQHPRVLSWEVINE